jgi:riboflavin synthase
MFTGIVEELGVVDAAVPTASGPDRSARLTVHGPLVSADASPGDSIAVSGVCLTVVDVAHGRFSADVMAETLARSTLGRAAAGAPVNLERAVTVATRLGGHLVQGHVDGVGRLVERTHTAGSDVVSIAVPATLSRYLAEKGSVAVDGVSLTVVSVDDDTFNISLIPTTLQRTTLGRLAPGDEVNVEVDVMAKYAERLLAARTADSAGGPR